MKKRFANLVLAVVIGFGASAFTKPNKEKKEINTTDSQIIWKGYKVTGSHAGTLSLKEGYLEFEAGKLTGGNFVVDMTTLAVTDLSGAYKGKLEGHLKSGDFFGVEEHQTATLVFTEVKPKGKNSYTITGNLTIKGKTNPITFDFSVYGSKATAGLKVDRSLYDVKYGSGSFFENLGDKTIYDEFDLVVDLVF